MELDARTAGAWVERWWIEAALGLVALVGVATGVRGGDPVRVVVAVALAAAVVDRVRLRIDNRSLAVAVTAVRDQGVSTVRRETGIAVEREEGEAGAEAARGGTVAGVDGGPGPGSGSEVGAEPDRDPDPGPTSEPESGATSESGGPDAGEDDDGSGTERPDVEDVIQSATDDEGG